jgi:zinc transport system substrate-binding protein
MKFWRAATVALCATALVALAGCSGSADAQPDGRLRVSAAFYPFEFVAERVGGDQVRVNNLTPPGSEPHDLELTPRQVAALATDDLVVFQSGFQPAVDAAITQAEPERVVDTASFLSLRTVGIDGAGGTDAGGQSATR